MNASADPPPAFPSGSPPPLRARRCSRHSVREAVAKCPVCAGFFCRECIVEHEGRLICALCLGRQIAVAASASAQRRDSRATLRSTVTIGLSLLFLWALFYGFGSVLLRIPTAVHDGTVWRDSKPGRE